MQFAFIALYSKNFLIFSKKRSRPPSSDVTSNDTAKPETSCTGSPAKVKTETSNKKKCLSPTKSTEANKSVTAKGGQSKSISKSNDITKSEPVKKSKDCGTTTNNTARQCLQFSDDLDSKNTGKWPIS